ncbi:type II toxin-antitoxin system toxin TscT [Staphylococcus capitis]|uniref:type II toxin-antitoxin system toxin TscT n=1 Tax=Staphylococcus capitis TaxID=29388 RepID=UPI002F268D7F
MDWDLRNLFDDLEVVQEKIDDVITSFAWFDEEYFTHEPKHVLSKDEILAHGYRYHEHRIQNTQTIDLLIMYQKEFNEVIERFKKIEKTLPDNDSLATKSDNA